MLFNSYSFIFVFLPLTLIVFFALTKKGLYKAGTASLVIASLAFYAYWNIRYLPLLLLSMVFNYSMGSMLEKTRSKGLLFFALLVDLGLLGYFKYMDFFLRSWNAAFDTAISLPGIILPLGISFFTFTQIAYIVDAYRGETENYSFLNYSLFVTFFPHLIAGPILYHKDMIPQFKRAKHFVFSHKNFALGLTVFALGLFKKVVVADSLIPWVKPIFEQAGSVGFFEAWSGAMAYTFQLYFDFSGYSEMAIGLGLLLNVRLPLNFDSPYKSFSIIEFWRRWHITLSAFLKRYLYIPLGGNRHGQRKKMRNLLITMLLGGLWHGAGWTYVIWGGLHGLYLVINHTWQRFGVKLPKGLAWVFTFLAVVFAWVFFRSATVQDALALVQTMLGFKGIHFAGLQQLVGGTTEVLVLMALLLFVVTGPNVREFVSRFRPTWQWAVLVSLVLVVSLLQLTQVTEFLYFQF